MTLQSFGKSALRVTKNYSKGYSSSQIKARNATCNDPWPPSGKDMFDLAQMTYNQADFIDIMVVIDKRLNDNGKNWRHVFKSLLVLDYLLHSGSENVILYCEENLYIIKTLREFQYIDDELRDQGANVRQKAKDITNLLSDKRRLFDQRRTRSQMHDRMRFPSRSSADTDDSFDESALKQPRRRPLPNGLSRIADREEEDKELRRAIEESQRSAAMQRTTVEDQDLQRAIKLSEKEERTRKKMEEENARALFDDSNQLPLPASQQQPLIDASLPLQMVAPGIPAQFTVLQPPYTSLQPQYNTLQPQYTALRPQFTSYSPYTPRAQQEATQFEALRLQAELARQQELQAAHARQEVFFQQQPQPQILQQPLVPQSTALGSNNPFLPNHASERSSSAKEHSDRPVVFNLTGTYDGHEPNARLLESERRREREGRREKDGESQRNDRDDALLRPFTTGPHPRERGGVRDDARLASLFANFTGDGVDTFGNVGHLRFGQTEWGRLATQKTGAGAGSGSNNPFLRSSERTENAQSTATTGDDMITI